MTKSIRYIWTVESFCNVHWDASGASPCDCPPLVKGSRWRLFVEGVKSTGCVTQFDSEGPFYGTWEGEAGGRTGPMSTLDAAKSKVMSQVTMGPRQ